MQLPPLIIFTSTVTTVRDRKLRPRDHFSFPSSAPASFRRIPVVVINAIRPRLLPRLRPRPNLETLSNLQPPSLPHYSQPTNPSNAHPTPILLLVAFFCLEVQFNQPSRVYETRPLAPHSATL
ncbi:hypothetical protein CGGC5_v001254 [Colletotrichum fructicola Nara gc5]|uniref:Uncharacterized protein n=1 Tax=Colletotrichum fructicola (strain Nara gc5) TaxID=1213859 RepID=A0A7J6JQD2_COLFN|nr:hypothetical protein CFRS1_v010216 [Colletotrichum fructicola]KAF4492648.1 hypothetical protein CGGC5_v001254 [Colletotrichum fructicola Nara gc5]